MYSLQAQITAVADSTFHATGYLEIDQSETGHAIAMQSDFKIVVAGMSPDIVTASLKAIVSALNRIARQTELAVKKAA